jgi:hypothetical protein
MYDAGRDWEALMEDLAAMGLDDPDDDDYAEATRPGTYRTSGSAGGYKSSGGAYRSGSGQPVRYASPRQGYATGVKGTKQGTVETPQGAAAIKMPDPLVTVSELTQTVDTIQSDMQTNAGGIRDLVERHRRDVACLARMIRRTDQKLTRGLKKAELAAVISASLPLVVRLVQRQLTPPADNGGGNGGQTEL